MFNKILLFSVGLFVICDATGIFRGGTCPTVRIKYGRARYRQKGRFAKFVCNTGYIVAGEKYSTCVNGTWDGPPPKCVRASCKKVNPPIDGLIYPSHRGAVLNFFCKPGFDLRGFATLYCDGHNWDNNLPSCIATNTTPPLTCDFETPNLCGWNHDLRHDFDWTRMNLKTPSGHLGTGPSYDHTLGDGKNGYYMYIESSSRKINDTARLISPIYDKMDENDVCLDFFYHMHGASTGQLRVYLKKLSDPWILHPENAIFWKWGNHGDKWLHSFIHLGPINEDFQIIIEGVRGGSFYSDIAIDDVSIIQNCTARDITTERDVVYTIDYSPTQSCFNRCGDSDNATLVTTNLQRCGCDDTCTDNNTCCPDYIALCVVGITDEGNTTTETTIFQAETSSTRSTTKKSNKTSTIAPKSTSVFSPTTTDKNVQNLTTQTSRNRTSVISSTTDRSTFSFKKNTTTKSILPVNLPNSPAQPSSVPAKPQSTSVKPQSTPAKPPTVLEKPPNVTEKLPSLPEKVPNVSVKPPSVSVKPQNRSDMLPNAPEKPPNATEKSQSVPIKPPNVPEKDPNIPKKPVVPVITFEKPAKSPNLVTLQPSVPKVPNFTKYVAKQNFSIAVSISSNPTTPIFDEIITIPVSTDNRDNEDEVIAPVIHRYKETLATSRVQNEKIVKEAPTSSTTIVVVAVLSVSGILIVILSVALIKRYRYTCSRTRIRGFGSQSQSDVRFLTSDEVLDFNLAYPDE